MMGVILFTGCDKEEMVPESKLPGAIQTYITTHFPGNPITQMTEEKDFLKKSYEVFLDGGFQLDFNNKNEIASIEGTTELPDSVIPSEILVYVAENYPNNVITDWELDDKNQQIGLDNSLDLEFTMADVFLRIDN
jgi:hypothetical protein